MSEGHSGAGFPARGIAYLDRRFVPMEEAKISIATHAFNYGTGCFEGIRGYWNSEREELYLVKLQKHFQRLLNSTRLFRIDIGHDLQQLCDVAIEVVRRTGYREDVYVRPIAYKASPVIKVGLLHLQDGFCCFSAPMAHLVAVGGFNERLPRFSDLDLYIRLLGSAESAARALK